MDVMARILCQLLVRALSDVATAWRLPVKVDVVSGETHASVCSSSSGSSGALCSSLAPPPTEEMSPPSLVGIADILARRSWYTARACPLVPRLLPAAGDPPFLCDLVREVDMDVMMQVLMAWWMLLMEVRAAHAAAVRRLRFDPVRATSELYQVGAAATAIIMVMVAVRMR